MPGMIGAIITPKKKIAPPKCSDITVNEYGQFTLQNESKSLGTVFGLMESDLVFTSEYEINEYVDASRGSEYFQNVMTRIAQNPSKSAVVTLKQGESFSLSTSFILESAHKFKYRHVVIKSDNANNPATITSSGESYIQWKDINVSLDGVVFSNQITNESLRANVSLNDVSTLRWISKESELSVEDVSFGLVNSTYPAIELYQSKVSHLSGQVSIQGSGAVVAALEGGSWNTDGGDVSLYMNGATFGIQVDSGEWSHRRGTFSVSGTGSPTLAMYSGPESSVRFSSLNWEQTSSTDYSIYISGHVYITDSNIKTGSNSDVGIYTDSGSVLRLNNSVIGSSGSAPNIGLLDNGASSVSGNVNVYGSICTSQGIYEEEDVKVVYEYGYLASPDGTIEHTPRDATVEQPEFSKYFQRATINCL